MNPVRNTASQSAGKKEERRPEPFSGRGPMAEGIEGMDLQRCLYNDFEMGSVQPPRPRGYLDFPEQNYDHHLF